MSIEFTPGSPAHAGIDPTMAGSSFPCLRFPRTRGDRPRFERYAARIDGVDTLRLNFCDKPTHRRQVVVYGELVPPHTRG